jgi:hypothetical protein
VHGGLLNNISYPGDEARHRFKPATNRHGSSSFPYSPASRQISFLHFHIVCLTEFTGERVHAHFEQNANAVTNAGEGGAKPLL